MTIRELIDSLKEKSKALPKGLDSKLVLATGLISSVKILSIYPCRNTMYIDVGEEK